MYAYTLHCRTAGWQIIFAAKMSQSIPNLNKSSALYIQQFESGNVIKIGDGMFEFYPELPRACTCI